MENFKIYYADTPREPEPKKGMGLVERVNLGVKIKFLKCKSGVLIGYNPEIEKPMRVPIYKSV